MNALPPTVSSRDRTLAVKERALALGFDACGIAQAGDIDPEDRLGQWLARGYHADMDWIVRTKHLRQDVRKKLPRARAVVVIARNYYAPRPAAQRHAGRVSRYAWGRDYHRALAKPLRALAEFIAGLGPDGVCYRSIDTGPVSERSWAMRAGVGWIGKNGLIIRPGLGSWLFLGVIVTTVALGPDAPSPDRCGDCRRCIDACPTGAIIAPRLVDARKCISYHTIENRGSIPEGLRPRFADWLFGCDVCQEVCPWNGSPKITSAQDFHPRPGHAFLDLDTVLNMDEATFSTRFAGTPIRRATLPALQRNARIVTANLGGKCPDQ